jgi:hypothetical protein
MLNTGVSHKWSKTNFFIFKKFLIVKDPYSQKILLLFPFQLIANNVSFVAYCIEYWIGFQVFFLAKEQKGRLEAYIEANSYCLGSQSRSNGYPCLSKKRSQGKREKRAESELRNVLFQYTEFYSSLRRKIMLCKKSRVCARRKYERRAFN